MRFERDEFFFHYTTGGAAFEHIIPRQRLRFSRYMEMRDPLENKWWRFGAGGWGEPDEAEKERQFAGYRRFDYLANQIRERSFLLAVTIDADADRTGEREPFCMGWARARMWEQYAEKHEGVCLVFHREKLIESIVHSLRDQGFAAPYHQEVIYHGAGMQKPMLDLNALAEDISPEKVAAYIEAHHDVLFFHKVLDWQTEHEYRFSTTSSDKEQLFVDYGESLAAVITGEKFPPWQKPAAIRACMEAEIDPLRLDWSAGKPVIVELREVSSRREMIEEAVAKSRSGPASSDA